SVKDVNEMTENIVNKEIPLLMADQKLATTMANRIAAVRAYVLFGNPDYKEQFYTYTELSKEYQAQAEVLAASEEFDQLIVETAVWRESIIREVFDEYDKGNEEIALFNLGKLAEVGSELTSRYEGIADNRER